MLIFYSVPKLSCAVRETPKIRKPRKPSTHYSEGNENWCEAKKSRVKARFGLNEAQYIQARLEFKKICLDHQISGKKATDEVLWDRAKNELVAHNAAIRDALFAEGAEEEHKKRAGILDTFCRQIARNTKRASTESVQGQAAASSEEEVRQANGGSMLMPEIRSEASNELNVKAEEEELMSKEEEEEWMEAEEAMREDLMREATADAANTREILRIIADQRVSMSE